MLAALAKFDRQVCSTDAVGLKKVEVVRHKGVPRYAPFSTGNLPNMCPCHEMICHCSSNAVVYFVHHNFVVASRSSSGSPSACCTCITILVLFPHSLSSLFVMSAEALRHRRPLPNSGQVLGRSCSSTLFCLSSGARPSMGLTVPDLKAKRQLTLWPPTLRPATPASNGPMAGGALLLNGPDNLRSRSGFVTSRAI